LTESDEQKHFVPAVGYDFLTRFYDLIVRLALREERFKTRLIEQAEIEPGHRVLDLGCGTATLTMMLKRAYPEATVVGLDGDPRILAIGRRKVAASGLDVELCEGMTYAPPFEAGSFDRVVTSLMLHHLTSEQRRRTFAKVHDLLRSGGEFHIADWGKPQNRLMQLTFLSVRILDGFHVTSDNVHGRLGPMLEESGFVSVGQTRQEMTLLGTLAMVRAVRP
jgi:ubiquinone/menaquinone biosynthesis C-methylase UbiE